MATKKAKAWEPKNKVLLLRTCDQDMKAYGGFVWPKAGYVEATDWKPTASCGNGLHGLLWGEGDEGHLNTAGSWLVVAAEQSELVNLDGKHKFPRCVVVHCGDQQSATSYLIANGAAGKRVHYGTATAGDSGTATAGHGGTATAGYYGTATAGVRGTATAGVRGTATAGDSGTATAGYGGTATAGDRGTATAGDSGTATAGYGGTATAGDSGMICIQWYDDKTNRYRLAMAEVDGEAIKANTPYIVRNGKLVEKHA